MTRYSIEADSAKTCAARGAYLRVHYKHTREVGAAIKGMPLLKAIKYLEDVLEHKQAIPFLVHNGGCGRHAQGHMRNAPGNNVRWPQKASKFYLGLLKNCVANAEAKGMEVDDMTVTHVQANQAPNMRRRTYRAHGRIGPYKSCPAHIEIICSKKAETVEKAEETKPRKLSRKQLSQRRLKQGGGLVDLI